MSSWRSLRRCGRRGRTNAVIAHGAKAEIHDREGCKRVREHWNEKPPPGRVGKAAGFGHGPYKRRGESDGGAEEAIECRHENVGDVDDLAHGRPIKHDAHECRKSSGRDEIKELEGVVPKDPAGYRRRHYVHEGEKGARNPGPRERGARLCTFCCTSLNATHHG